MQSQTPHPSMTSVRRVFASAALATLLLAAMGIHAGAQSTPGVLWSEAETTTDDPAPPADPRAHSDPALAGRDANTPPVAGSVADWLVSDVMAGTTLTAADGDGVVPGLDLRLDRTTVSGAPVWSYSSTVLDDHGDDRSVTLAFTIPLDATGWTWWDDAERERTIGSSQTYSNLTEGYYGALIMASRYPIAVVDNGTTALCLAVPPHPGRAVRFLYDGPARQFRAEFDFGLSPVPESFPSRADATVIAFEVDSEWAFRRALARYYEIYIEHLDRRAGRGGGLLRGSPLAPIDNPGDFHFAWHDFAEEYSPVPDWAELDHAHGIESYLYREPQTHWRGIRGELEHAFAVDFDDGGPGPLSPSGSVTFENGRAVIGPSGALEVPGFPTEGPRDFEAEFTIHNLPDLLPLGTYELGWQGRFWAGLRKTGATGGVGKVGAFDYSAAGAQTGTPWEPATSTRMTVRMVVRNTENVTRVFAAYGDEARHDGREPVFRHAGVFPWGKWTGEPGTQLLLRNYASVPVEIDDARVRFYGPPEDTSYASYLAQLEDEAQRWNREARSTLVSGSFDADGRYNLYLESVAWTPQAPFGVNAAPGVPDTGFGGWPNKAEYETDVLGFWLGWRDYPSLMDGAYYDSMQGWGNLRNYRREHWRTTEYPLTFDRTNANAVCLQNIWANVAHAGMLAGELQRHGQKLMGNDTYHQVWYHMPFVDIAGRELSNYSNGAWSPPGDDTYLYWRAMAARRPFWTLANDRYDEAFDPRIAAHMEEYFQRSLFYGVFPGMYHPHDGISPWYWATPEYYERDRPLFRKYMPIIQDLDLAGWEPVPYARPNVSSVRVERFGRARDENLAFTLHNRAPSAQRVELVLLKEPLRVSAITEVVELIHGHTVTVSPQHDGTVRVELNMPGNSFAAIAVGAEAAPRLPATASAGVTALAGAVMCALARRMG